MTRARPDTCAEAIPDADAPTGMFWECGRPAAIGFEDTALCEIHTHTPADPGADECAADAAGEWERDLREYGVEL